MKTERIKKSEPISALFPLLTLQNRETELSLLATKTDRVNSCGMTGIEGSGWCEREICRGSLACIWLQGHGTDMPVKRQIWESGGVRDLRETVSFTTSNALSGSESGVTIRVWFSKEIYEYHIYISGLIHIKSYICYQSHKTGNTNSLYYGCLWRKLYVVFVIRGGEVFM